MLLQVKVDNSAGLHDITSVVAIAGCYCTMEPYIDSKYDLYIQKIGSNYRTFVYVRFTDFTARLIARKCRTVYRLVRKKYASNVMTSEFHHIGLLTDFRILPLSNRFAIK